jgi:hypothetical protein
MALIQKAFSDIVTFSRSSNATRIGPTGRVEYAPHNLLLRSQEFDNASWTQAASTTVTANSIAAPDGTITADLIGTNFVYQGSLTYAVATLSVFAKAGTSTDSFIYMDNSGAKICRFNAQTGVITATPAGYTSSITSVGNGWYRVTMTGQISGACGVGQNGSGNGYFWGAQLSVGPYPLDYTPTTSAAVYGPRFDYDPVTLAARGLLVEEQRTNLITYSEQFDNAAWTKEDLTVTANAATAPDGTVTADLILPNTSSADHSIFEYKGGSSSQTFSVYAKAGGYNYIFVGYNNNSASEGVFFDLSAGTVSQNTSGLVASISNAGNGWYRCSVTKASGFEYAMLCTSANGTSLIHAGNGSSGLYLWGAQLEAGSFATSYIPTVAATVTRSADVASVNTLSPWWNASAGTFFIENTFGNYGNQPIALSDQAAVGNAWIYGGSGVIQAYIVGPNINLSSGVSVSANIYAKSAFAFGADGKAISVNGSTPVVSANTTAPTASTQLSLGNWPGGSYYINGHIKRVAYYPRKLSSAELSALTA